MAIKGNVLAMKRAKNFCNNLDKTNKKFYFQKVTRKGFANNKTFWNTIKPFLTNKGILTSDGIALTQIKRKQHLHSILIT